MADKATLVVLLILLGSVTATAGEIVTRYDLASGIGETRLENGLTVLTLERHTAPLVSCQIWFGVGSVDEAPGQTGLAHFLEHLMFKGTDRYAKGEIDRITLKNGGSNNAATSKDWTYYYFNFASDRWMTALQIEANRMRNLAFAPAEFEAERKVVIEELQIGRDAPWTELDETIEAIAYTAHPYKNPIIGWKTDVERISREEVKAFYDRHYHPGNAIIVLVGDFETRNALAKIVSLFAGIPAGNHRSAPRSAEPPQNGERRFVVHRDAELARLEVIYHTVPASHPDDAVLDVLRQILVGGKSARLTRRLAEEERLVTFVSASNDTREDPGIFWIWSEVRAGVEPEKVEAALNEETGRLRTELVTEDELARAKSSLRTDLVFGRATAENLASEIGYLATIADWRLTVTAEERLLAVTREDLRRVAHQVFSPANRTVGMELPGGRGNAGAKPASPPRRSPRSTTAAVGAGPSLRLSPTVIKLDNGLILLLSRHSTIPVLALRAHTNAGRLWEARPGLGTLTGRYLLEGAGDRNGQALADELSRLGAMVDTSATGLSARCLTENAQETIAIVADILMRPTLPESSFTKLRDRQLSELRSEADNPERLARRAFERAVYGDHPYANSTLGTKESLSLLTHGEIQDHHRWFYGPNHMVISAVSDLPIEEMRVLLEAAFRDWAPRLSPPREPPPEIPAPAPNTIEIPRETDQANIYVGHVGIKRSDPDYTSLLVMDYVLGMSPGFTDRLSRTLRDRDGLAYNVYATIALPASHAPGTFFACIGTSAHQRDRAIEGIVAEIERIRTEEVTPEELADSKAYLTGSFVFRYETAVQMSSNLIYLYRHGLGFDYPARFAERIAAVTSKEVLRVARKHLRPEHLIKVSVGPIR